MSYPNTSIRKARVIDPACDRDEITDVHIADGKILAIGAAPSGFEAANTIDADGYWLIPGLVDLCARLREPGFEYRASLESELAAAVAGGVTSLCCPPDTDPPLDEPGLIEMLQYRAQKISGTRLYPLGALTVAMNGKVITEMAQLSQAGCIGFGQPKQLPVDSQTVLHALQYASTYGYTVWLWPQDPHLGRGGVAHSGALASRLGLSGVPVSAETVALLTIFELVKQTGAKVHLCRISSAAGVELIARAKADGLPITADVAVHHLHLTDIDIGFFDSRFRVDPPFRSQRDRDGLRRGLLDGTIDVVCSDHTPVDDDNKHLPFAQAEPGTSALELLLPLLMKWAHEEGVSPVTALAKLTVNSAAVIGIEAGSLRPGVAADFCLYRADQDWLVNAANMRSQCHHTPFFGLELRGRIHRVFVAGQSVMTGREHD